MFQFKITGFKINLKHEYRNWKIFIHKLQTFITGFSETQLTNDNIIRRDEKTKLQFSFSLKFGGPEKGRFGSESDGMNSKI